MNTEKVMVMTKKVTPVGSSSLCVIIDRTICKELGIVKGSFIELAIRNTGLNGVPKIEGDPVND